MTVNIPSVPPQLEPVRKQKMAPLRRCATRAILHLRANLFPEYAELRLDACDDQANDSRYKYCCDHRQPARSICSVAFRQPRKCGKSAFISMQSPSSIPKDIRIVETVLSTASSSLSLDQAGRCQRALAIEHGAAFSTPPRVFINCDREGTNLRGFKKWPRRPGSHRGHQLGPRGQESPGEAQLGREMLFLLRRFVCAKGLV